MKIRSYLFAVLVGVLGSQSLWAMAPKPGEEPAPEFLRNSTWLQSEPLSKKNFSHQVTLVYFWDYTSVNCLRDRRYLELWQQRYQNYGLKIIWVHAPEFKFAASQTYVEKALKHLKISGPVVIDNDFKLWEAYKVYSWPSKVVVDSKGLIVYRAGGEGKYMTVEAAIRRQLNIMNPQLLLPEIVVRKEPQILAEECGLMTGETYMGYKRVNWWGGQVANKQFYKQNETSVFKDRGDRVQRGFFLHGLWSNHEDGFVHARETKDLADYLGLLYYGREVYSVISPPEESQKEIRVYVTRDELPLPEDMRGVDIVQDDEGGTYVPVDSPRLYQLIRHEDGEQHEIKLWMRDQEVAVSSFSFSNACMSEVQPF